MRKRRNGAAQLQPNQVTTSVEKDRTLFGLCEECYQRLRAQDSALARWAFKHDENPK